MEYKTKTNVENYEHIIPLFSAIDSSYKGSKVVSPCERPCVCVCVCKHGKSSSMDFSREKELEEKGIEKLFEKALAA